MRERDGTKLSRVVTKNKEKKQFPFILFMSLIRLDPKNFDRFEHFPATGSLCRRDDTGR